MQEWVCLRTIFWTCTISFVLFVKKDWVVFLLPHVKNVKQKVFPDNTVRVWYLQGNSFWIDFYISFLIMELLLFFNFKSAWLIEISKTVIILCKHFCYYCRSISDYLYIITTKSYDVLIFYFTLLLFLKLSNCFLCFWTSC